MREPIAMFSGVEEAVTSICFPDAPPTLTGTGLEVSRFGCLWNHDSHSLVFSGAGTFVGSLGLLGSKTWLGLVKMRSPFSGPWTNERVSSPGVSLTTQLWLMLYDSVGSNSVVMDLRCCPSGMVAPPREEVSCSNSSLLIPFARLRSALLKSASLKSASLKSALLKSAPLKSAPLRLALVRWALLRSAPFRTAPLSLASLRLAPLRLA